MKRYLLLFASILLIIEMRASAIWVGQSVTCDASSAVMGLTSDISWSIGGAGYISLTGTGFYRTATATQYWSGTATVTCKWKYRLYYGDSWHNASKTWTFTCNDNPVSIYPTSLELSVGGSGHVGYSHKYSNSYVSAANAYFSSSNSGIATVTSSGEVVGVSPGTCYINVYSKISANTPYCKVTVKPINPTSAFISSPINIVAGNTKQLSVSITPYNATVTSTEWYTTNSSIATINTSGVLTGVKHGSTTVYCIVNGSLKSNEATVNVSKATLTLAASKNDGLLEKNSTIKLTASSKNADIYYTTDGSIPSNESKHYTEPIAIDKDMTLKAIAYHDDYNPSKVLVKTYKVTSLKLVKSYPDNGNSVGDYTSIMLEYNLPIDKGVHFEDIKLLRNGIPIDGNAFISDTCFYYVPLSKMGNGEYTLIIPQNALKARNKGDECLEYQSMFSVAYKGVPYPINFGGDYVIKSDQSLWKWGLYCHQKKNTYTILFSPKKIMDGVINASLCGTGNAAIKEDGTLWCWGSNEWGQLGLGHTDFVSSATKVTDNVKSVATAEHMLILKNDGTVWSCGYNACGQLGNGFMGTTTNPNLCKISIEDVDTIAANTHLSAAIKKDGSLYTWGRAEYNGTGNYKTDRTTPVKILSDVKKVHLTWDGGYAIKNDNSLWSWGYESTSKKIMDNVLSVGGGAYTTLCIKTDGKLYAWGWNDYGQLGNGTTSNAISSYNEAVCVLDSVLIGTSADNRSAGAMKANGSIWTWGTNTYYGLGYSEDDKAVQLVPKLLMEGKGNDTICIDEVSFLYEDVTLNIGDSIAIPLIISPNNVNYSEITYSVDNTSIATVTNNGIVVARSCGSTMVRTSVTDATGSMHNACYKVTITDEITGIKDVSNNKNVATIIGYYDLNGRQHKNLQKGINLIRYSNGETKKIIIK